MRNSFTDYKILLRTFSYNEQIKEINEKINKLVNKKQHGNKIDRRYKQIKDLKHMKNNVINRLQLIYIYIYKYIYIYIYISNKNFT